MFELIEMKLVWKIIILFLNINEYFCNDMFLLCTLDGYDSRAIGFNWIYTRIRLHEYATTEKSDQTMLPWQFSSAKYETWPQLINQIHRDCKKKCTFISFSVISGSPKKNPKTAEMESNYFFGDDERSKKGTILTSLTNYNHTSSTGFVI